MTLLEKLSGDMIQAMKAQNKPLLGVLRLLVSGLKYKLIDVPELSSDDEVKFLMSEAKKRKESIEAYKNVSPERAAAEQFELELIETYLPAQMSDQELLKIVREVREANPNLEMGPLTGKVMAQIKQTGGIVDGGRVKAVIESIVG